MSAAWEVGQTVIVRRARHRGNDTTGVVTKIGRKYVTVEAAEGWPKESRYLIETGYEQGDSNYPARILTPETDALETRRREALASLAQFGWRPTTGYGFTTTPLETLEAMVVLFRANGGRIIEREAPQ